MPTCSFDGVTKTPTDTLDPWSFPILSAWPNLSLRAEQVGHKAGDRIAVVVGRYGGESIIDLDHVALIEVDKL